MKKSNYILFIIGFSFLTTYSNFVIAAENEKNHFVLKEFVSDFLKSNNTLLQGIIAFLIILIFAYSAKLFYERNYNNK